MLAFAVSRTFSGGFVSLACTQDFSGAHGTEEHAQRGFSDDAKDERFERLARVVFFAFPQLST